MNNQTKMVIGIAFGCVLSAVNYLALCGINMLADHSTAAETWSTWWPIYLFAIIVPPLICFLAAYHNNTLGRIILKGLLSIPLNIAAYLLLAIIGAISYDLGGIVLAILLAVLIYSAFSDRENIIVLFFEK